MKNLLIFNAFPTNNGDAALVFSLYEKINKKCDYNVSIAAHKYDLISGLYDEYPIYREITDYTFLNKIKGSSYLKPLLTPLLFFLSKPFLQSKYIVASPGGFMNSYYGFSRIAMTFIICKLFGKKTGIYSQSFGPFSARDGRLMKFLSRFIDVLYCRDQFSFDVLSNLKIDTKRISLVEDGAFLIPFKKNQSASNTIAISVRSWNHDSRDERKYVDMIKSFVDYLVKQNFKVEFISTCQGLQGYIDDSKFALKIYDLLSSDVKNNVFVNHQYYKLSDLLNHLEKFKAVIGTRLHMCILSMLRGKPCLNISYEIKGKEAFNYLGLGDYSIDYNEEHISAHATLIKFISNLENLEIYIEKKMQEQNKKADEYLNNFLLKLE